MTATTAPARLIGEPTVLPLIAVARVLIGAGAAVLGIVATVLL